MGTVVRSLFIPFCEAHPGPCRCQESQGAQAADTFPGSCGTLIRWLICYLADRHLHHASRHLEAAISIHWLRLRALNSVLLGKACERPPGGSEPNGGGFNLPRASVMLSRNVGGLPQPHSGLRLESGVQSVSIASRDRVAPSMYRRRLAACTWL